MVIKVMIGITRKLIHRSNLAGGAMDNLSAGFAGF